MVEMMTDMNDRDIRICDNKGFHMDLPNGVTVSVQLGPGNYCDPDVSNAAMPTKAPVKFGKPGQVTSSDIMLASS